MEVECTQTNAESLHRSLANGETSRQHCRGVCATSCEFSLAIREDSFCHAWRTGQRSRKTIDIDGVDPHADHAQHPRGTRMRNALLTRTPHVRSGGNRENQCICHRHFGQAILAEGGLGFGYGIHQTLVAIVVTLQYLLHHTRR